MLCCVESHWMLQEANQYSDWAESRGEELHAAFNSLLKCFSHAWDHAVSVSQTFRPATITLAATCCLGLLLWSWSPVGLGARAVRPRCWSSPGQVRLKVGVGERETHRVNNETCACGTAPPEGPGTEVSRSAAGRGAPAGLWHWPALGGPESAYGPGSLLELGRSGWHFAQ